MANVLGTLFGEIAGAIREKTGETGTMKPAEFAQKIADLQIGGGSDGVQIYQKMHSINGAYNSRVSVDFGFKPDLLILYNFSSVSTANVSIVKFGISTQLAEKYGISAFGVNVCTTNTAGASISSTSYGIDANVSNVGGAPICGCDETGFTIGKLKFNSGSADVFAMKLM